MASQWKQQCPGFATYRWHEDGAIEVKGQGFPQYDEGSTVEESIRSFWNTYGQLFAKHAASLGLPVAWVVGIVAVESGGDEWACSPCAPPWCGLSNCGGGVASDGKHYVCCAYGLMQVIDSNARYYGMNNGAELLGNPDDSIRIGCEIYKKNVDRSEGDPLMGVRYYNGCRSVCKGGRVTVCNPKCMFGIGGQNNYAEKFAKTVNTFLDMDIGHQPPTYVPPYDESKSSITPAVAIGAGAFALGWYLFRSRN